MRVQFAQLPALHVCSLSIRFLALYSCCCQSAELSHKILAQITRSTHTALILFSVPQFALRFECRGGDTRNGRNGVVQGKGVTR